MGIRYYAYAFDGDMTTYASANPHAMISDDPLADAWGLEPGAQISEMVPERVLPERELLYLDKAWRDFQQLTGPLVPGAAPRPAYRMFEGSVTWRGMGWDAWVRALSPEEIPEIARDLEQFVGDWTDPQWRSISGLEREEAGTIDYLHHYLLSASVFVAGLIAGERGMVYTIR